MHRGRAALLPEGGTFIENCMIKHKWRQYKWSQKKLYIIISIFQCFPGRRLLPLHFLLSQTLETNCLWTQILPNCWALSELQTAPTKILPSLYLEIWISWISYHWSNDPATLLMASHCFSKGFMVLTLTGQGYLALHWARNWTKSMDIVFLRLIEV